MSPAMSTTGGIQFSDDIVFELVSPEHCASCTYWHRWRAFDDQAIGHCVITCETPEGEEAELKVQGLTGFDFRCNSYRRKVLTTIPGDENP